MPRILSSAAIWRKLAPAAKLASTGRIRSANVSAFAAVLAAPFATAALCASAFRCGCAQPSFVPRAFAGPLAFCQVAAVQRIAWISAAGRLKDDWRSC